jgi:hypothetical protein
MRASEIAGMLEHYMTWQQVFDAEEAEEAWLDSPGLEKEMAELEDFYGKEQSCDQDLRPNDEDESRFG